MFCVHKVTEIIHQTLYLTICYWFQKYFTDKNRSCPDSYIRCPSSYCVSLESLCDGAYDCQDGADEQNCETIKQGTTILTLPQTVFAQINLATHV